MAPSLFINTLLRVSRSPPCGAACRVCGAPAKRFHRFELPLLCSLQKSEMQGPYSLKARIHWRMHSINSIYLQIDGSDVVGAVCETRGSSSKASAFSIWYCPKMPRTAANRKVTRRLVKTIQMCASSEADAQRIVAAVRARCGVHSQGATPRRVLVIINPHSGRSRCSHFILLHPKLH